MNKIIFEDLCQNFIEEVNFLIPTEKNKFVDIVVSFDKANFGDEKKNILLLLLRKRPMKFSVSTGKFANQLLR